MRKAAIYLVISFLVFKLYLCAASEGTWKKEILISVVKPEPIWIFFSGSIKCLFLSILACFINIIVSWTPNGKYWGWIYYLFITQLWNLRNYLKWRFLEPEAERVVFTHSETEPAQKCSAPQHWFSRLYRVRSGIWPIFLLGIHYPARPNTGYLAKYTLKNKFPPEFRAFNYQIQYTAVSTGANCNIPGQV